MSKECQVVILVFKAEYWQFNSDLTEQKYQWVRIHRQLASPFILYDVFNEYSCYIFNQSRISIKTLSQ